IGLRELQHHPEKGGSGGRKRKGHAPRGEAFAYWASKEVLKRPWLYRAALRVGGWLARLRARGGWLSALPGPGANWTKGRGFPAPAAVPFRSRWLSLKAPRQDGGGARRVEAPCGDPSVPKNGGGHAQE